MRVVLNRVDYSQPKLSYTSVTLRGQFKTFSSLRASSPIWASEASLARTAPRSRVLARLAQIGEFASRLNLFRHLSLLIYLVLKWPESGQEACRSACFKQNSFSGKFPLANGPNCSSGTLLVPDKLPREADTSRTLPLSNFFHTVSF